MATAAQLAQAKMHLRLEQTFIDEDSYISDLIDAAIEQVENDTQHRFNVVEERLDLPCFHSEIKLPACPVQSIVSIEYIDAVGLVVPLTAYYFSNASTKAVIRPVYGESFPSVLAGYDSVVIKYMVGLTVWPKTITQAVLMLSGHWYANRETVVAGVSIAELPMAYKNLIQSYRVPY